MSKFVLIIYHYHYHLLSVSTLFLGSFAVFLKFGYHNEKAAKDPGNKVVFSISQTCKFLCERFKCYSNTNGAGPKLAIKTRLEMIERRY